ncbi:MAG: GGDEF domain-containing protein [Deltaproteobacteria bacterium]|nr:GGDEF domain-containing protein [Deltaproteobacteria bacterium]
MVLAGKAVGRMFKVVTGEMLIGRAPECDIMLDDDGVSRKHARLICRPDGSVSILDLGSTNGTWVKSQRVDLRSLQDGDRIQIGSTSILKYGYQDSVEEQFHAQLYESATQDGLTGVYNKRFFLDRLDQEFAWHRRHQAPLTLMLFDIDHFKKTNDTFGHAAGDFVLKQLALVVLAQVRTEDIFARYGGEEFACILRQTRSQEGFVLAERIRRAVEDHRFLFRSQIQEVEIPTTISVGVCELKPTVKDIAAFIEATDRYLYRAKAAGRNRVESSAFDD